MAAKVSIEVSVDDKGVVTGLENVRGGIKKVGEEGNLVFTQLTEKQAMARKETEALAGSMNTAVVPSLRNARGEAALLGEEIGVKLPRHVRNFIAESSLLAPLMSAAFSATAVIFIGQVFLENTDRIKNMTAALGGFTDGMREMEKAARDANQELLANFKDNKVGHALLDETNAQIVALQKERDRLVESVNNPKFSLTGIDQVKDSLALKDVTEKLTAVENLRLRQIGQIQNNDVDAAKALKEHADKVHALKTEVDQLTPALERLSNTHSLAGATGADKILIEETQRIAELKALGATDGQARSAAEKEADDRILALRTQYHDKLKSIEDQAAQSGLDARDKSIEQEHERVDAALADYNREFGALDDLDKNKIAAQKDLETQLYAIHKVGSDERIKIDQDEAQKAADAAKHAAEEAQKTSEKLMKEHQQAVEKMGSELQSLFDDITSGKIGQRLLKNFEKLIFQMVAQWLMGMNQMQSGIGGLFSALLGIGGGGTKNGTGGFSLGSLFGMGGSSSGGGSFAGNGGIAPDLKPSDFLDVTKLGGSAGGSSFSLAGLGGLAVGGAMLGVGALFSNELSSILSPTEADRPKAQIISDVLSGGQNAGQIVQDYNSGKLLYGQAIDKLQTQSFYEIAELNMLGAGAQAADAAATLKANIDAINRKHDEKSVKGLQWGATQFHDGGEVMAGHGFRISPTEQLAILRDGEHVVKSDVAQRNRGTLNAMNNGGDGGGVQIHIHTMDPKNMEGWMRSGGAKQILRGISSYTREGGR